MSGGPDLRPDVLELNGGILQDGLTGRQASAVLYSPNAPKDCVAYKAAEPGVNVWSMGWPLV
jgi:hypothetical protein